MAKGTVDVEFTSGEMTSVGRRFAPGEPVRGTVTIVPEKKMKARHIYLRLEWYTEGRGDRDSGTGAELDLFQGELMAGVPVYYEFDMLAPVQPWSYNGHYVNIVWQLTVKVDIPLSGDLVTRTRIILSPEGRFAS